MPEFEHRWLERWTWVAFAKTGVLLMTIGIAPILLYTLLGPADGNPVGLGMWMVVVVPVGFLLLGLGLLKRALAWLQPRD